mmetsp:Transcript_29225/g.28296  ORF Transcript_29225/g.28296 Transcript_29225/m.28296 type:complete len:111 (-) Transcript_29225:5383-5715(-)
MQDLNGSVFFYVMREKKNFVNWIDLGWVGKEEVKQPQREPFSIKIPFDTKKLEVSEMRISYVNIHQIKVNMWSDTKFFSFIVPRNGVMDQQNLSLKTVALEEFNLEEVPQ